MLNKPVTTTENWGEILNENFDTIEDKMLYRAIATYDRVQAAHILQLQNIPPQHQDKLPQILPDTFAVSVRFLEAFTEGDIFLIGMVEFTPKNAAFEAGDILTVTFSQPEYKCYFSTGGGGGNSSVRHYTATVPATGWTRAAPYKQEVSVTGIHTTDIPILDVLLSDDAATAKAEQTEWAKVDRIDTADGKIILTCYSDLPGVDLNIQIMAVR